VNVNLVFKIVTVSFMLNISLQVSQSEQCDDASETIVKLL